METTLFKVRLTDPIVKARTKLQNVYLVQARSTLDAVEVLRTESPSAFAYNPEVAVEPYPHASMRVITMRVPIKKEAQS